jgi:signal transduction histidine kinase
VLVVSAQRVDGALLASLRQLHLKDVHVETATAQTPGALVLTDVDGRGVGRITWTPGRPGLLVLRDSALVLLLGFVVFAALAVGLGWTTWRVARQLSAHEQAHDAALRDLADARDRAEAANVAKSQFLANMSHEIRTPLNGVLGMAQVLARSPLAGADREKLDVIRASGESLLRILNDLLDLSKVEAGRMEIDVHDFDLGAERWTPPPAPSPPWPTRRTWPSCSSSTKRRAACGAATAARSARCWPTSPPMR